MLTGHRAKRPRNAQAGGFEQFVPILPKGALRKMADNACAGARGEKALKSMFEKRFDRKKTSAPQNSTNRFYI